MQVLKINKVFYDKLKNIEDRRKILKIYGYNTAEDFILEVIKKLNNEYNFLHIEKFAFLKDGEKKDFGGEYNGFVSGDVEGYELITVSFTTISGKEGNTFLNQEVVPLITEKGKDNQDFLLNNKKKKIIILTTHKSKIFSPDKNIIADSGVSNIQMSVKYANTIGFDVIEFFPIKNLSVNAKYHDIKELMAHADYLQKKKEKNNQYKQLFEEYGVYYASFGGTPKGNEVKFFSLKIYAAIILLRGKNINISKALKETSDITLIVLDGFIKYLQNTELVKYDIFQSQEENELELEIDINNNKEVVRSKEKECYKMAPIYSFNTKGKKQFKTQRKFKEESFLRHEYYCACHNEKHYYFKSESTKKKYVEGHHMIPMEYQDRYWKDKKVNLDCSINLIPLCGHCHGKIHKSIKEERIEIITEVYGKYEDNLLMIDKDLTLCKFAELYNVYIY